MSAPPLERRDGAGAVASWVQMRRLGLSFVVLLAGCGGAAAGGDEGGGRSARSCAAVLRWHGRLYVGTAAPVARLKPAQRLGPCRRALRDELRA